MKADAARVRRAVSLIGAAILVGVLLEQPLTGLLAPAAAAPESAPPIRIELPFPRVVDGSSLDGYINGRRVAIGYRGSIVPWQRERCGPEAAVRNRQLVGQRVWLEEGEEGPEIDPYGRRLYYVYGADGRSIEEQLLREGLGRARPRAARRAALQLAEIEASAARRGCLWRGS